MNGQRLWNTDEKRFCRNCQQFILTKDALERNGALYCPMCKKRLPLPKKSHKPRKKSVIEMLREVIDIIRAVKLVLDRKIAEIFRG